MKKFLLLSVVLIFAIVAMTPGQVGADEAFTDHFPYGAPVVDEALWDQFVQFGSTPLSGIFATNDATEWANSGTTLAWLITESNGTYAYEYTWHTWVRDLSHIIIELTDGITIPGGQIDLPDLNDSYSIASYYPGPGNPGMPGDIYGIKIDLGFDTMDYTFSFTTDQAPVWGNFYANGGGGTEIPGAIYAYNTGFPDFNDPDGVFIPRPDGAPVPEPATMLLLGTGLIGLAGIGRKRLRKR